MIKNTEGKKYRFAFEAIWDIFHQVVKKGDTFAFDQRQAKRIAKVLWISPPVHTFVAELHNKILGTLLLRKNQPDLGGHVQMQLIWYILRHMDRIGKDMGIIL